MFSTGEEQEGRRRWTISRHWNSINKENGVPARRSSMRKVKEVLRLRFELGVRAAADCPQAWAVRTSYRN
jgi:hypothetical protein